MRLCLFVCFLPANVGSLGLTSGKVSLRRAAIPELEPCCDLRARSGLGRGKRGAQGTRLKEASVSESVPESDGSGKPARLQGPLSLSRLTQRPPTVELI